jgi:hypothetical protein
MCGTRKSQWPGTWAWFVRLNYTTCVGDDVRLIEVQEKIASLTFKCVPDIHSGGRLGRLCPHVFKKGQRSVRAKRRL